jgi:hypothetical protein
MRSRRELTSLPSPSPNTCPGARSSCPTTYVAAAPQHRIVPGERRLLALLGSRPMVCSRKEQRTFLEGGGSSVRDPQRPLGHRSSQVQPVWISGSIFDPMSAKSSNRVRINQRAAEQRTRYQPVQDFGLPSDTAASAQPACPWRCRSYLFPGGGEQNPACLPVYPERLCSRSL